MTEEERAQKEEIEATLDDADEDMDLVVDVLAKKKKKKKKDKDKKSKVQLAVTETTEKPDVFDINNVEGHVNYTYMDLLARIEKTISQEQASDDEEEKDQRGLDPTTKFLSTTKTTWTNFTKICTQINREPQHVLDFYKAELDVEGNFGSEGNLILVGKWQNKHITNLYRQYLQLYVRCADCRKLNTKLERDSSTRLQTLTCQDCKATRTVQNIKKHFHAVKRGERKKERNK